jgi:hypothetical protein
VREKKNGYRIIVSKLGGKGPLERPECNWEENIKMYLRGIGWIGMDWINLAQDRD